MNKIKLFFVTLLLIFILTSCDPGGPPTIEGVEDVTITVGDDFDLLEGVSAADYDDNDITDDIVVSVEDNTNGNIVDFDTDEPFVFKVYYQVEDDDGEETEESRIITVVAEVDATAPVISTLNQTINNTEDINLFLNAVATDDVDGVLSDDIVYEVYSSSGVKILSSEFDDLYGVYTIKCSVVDSSGNEATAEYTIDVTDAVSPVITTESYTMNNDQIFDPYMGVSAEDDIDGDITVDITYVITNSLGEEVPEIGEVAGVYTVNYSVEDSAGNGTSIDRTVTVLDVIPPTITQLIGYAYLEEDDVFDITEFVYAEDETDGDITLTVVINVEFGPDYDDTTGKGTVTYIIHAVDAAGNTSGSVAVGLNIAGDPVMFSGIPTLEAQEILNQYYDDIFGGVLTTAEVCTIYIADLPIPPPIPYEECLTGLEEIKSFVTGFSIDEVVSYYIDEESHFIATVTLTTAQGDVTFDVEYAIWGYMYRSDIYIDFISDPFVFDDGGGEGPVSVYLTNEQARTEIEIFYSLLNGDTSPADFCYLFVLLHDDMNPMSSLECQDFKTAHEGLPTRSYEVGVIEYIEGQNGGPPVYVASVTRTIGSEVKVYDALFFFFDDNASGFYLLTPGNNAIGELDMQAGGGDGPGFVEVPIEDALIIIEQYYADLTSMTASDFCATYLTLGPDTQPQDVSDCEIEFDAISVSLSTYTVTNVEFVPSVEGSPPYYVATVTSPNIPFEYNPMFIFLSGESSTIIVTVILLQTIGQLT